MIAEIKCFHCGGIFEDEILEKNALCPHCGKLTPVAPIKPADETQAPPSPPFVHTAAPTPQSLNPQKSPTPIENTLENIGDMFFFGGILGAAIGALCLVGAITNQNFELGIAAGVFAVVSLAQGWIVQTVFKA